MLANALVPLVSALAFATQIAAQNNNCSKVHIITARGSNEAPGLGDIGNRLGKNVSNDNAGTTIEGLNYPATLDNYPTSSAQGTAALKQRLSDYTQACPNAMVVLMGYSQGAHVIGDALCGGGDPMEFIGDFTAPADTTAGDKVVAIIQMGDPRFVPGVSYDVGTNTDRNGLFPRSMTAANESCSRYADRIQSYCDTGDPFCATGVDGAVHLTYLDKYGQDAEKFVDQKIKASATGTGTSTSSTASSTATHQSASVVSTELPSPLLLAVSIGIALISALASLV